jgi:hypothetical protein
MIELIYTSKATIGFSPLELKELLARACAQ